MRGPPLLSHGIQVVVVCRSAIFSAVVPRIVFWSELGELRFHFSRRRSARMCAKAISECSSARSKANPGVAIGSYPFFDPQHGANTNVVLRARDVQKLALAKRAVEDMLERVRQAQSKSA